MEIYYIAIEKKDSNAYRGVEFYYTSKFPFTGIADDMFCHHTIDSPLEEPVELGMSDEEHSPSDVVAYPVTEECFMELLELAVNADNWENLAKYLDKEPDEHFCKNGLFNYLEEQKKILEQYK